MISMNLIHDIVNVLPGIMNAIKKNQRDFSNFYAFKPRFTNSWTFFMSCEYLFNAGYFFYRDYDSLGHEIVNFVCRPHNHSHDV